MRNQKALTKLEVVVIIASIVLIIATFILLQCPIVRMHPRVFCGTQLKGLGTAMMVYAKDFDDRYPQLPGKGPWSKTLGFSYDMDKPDFSPGGAQEFAPRSITASWYLLVKYMDTNPKQFACPQSTQIPFGKNNSTAEDFVNLWDFGPDPYKHVSYSMQNPYSKFTANANHSALFAIASDMNPWFRDGNILSPTIGKNAPQIITVNDPGTFDLGNTVNHPILIEKLFWGYRTMEGTQEGQNVAFADGHNEYVRQPNVGINQDNIYTYWSTDEEPTAQDIQGGVNPTARDEQNDSKSEEDSFLAL